MACVEKIRQAHADSEREEGEIIDELDDLSDISSEEEFLLRQRLEVLENYNNVLGRTKIKRSSGVKSVLAYNDLSEISAAELDDPKPQKVLKHSKQYSKPRRRKELVSKHSEQVNVRRKRDYRKKSNSARRKPSAKVIESSDESEDEYRNKRKKLADAVVGHRNKTDTTTLSTRLMKMFHKPQVFSNSFHKEYQFVNLHHNNNYQRNNDIEVSAIPESIDEVDSAKSGISENQLPAKVIQEPKLSDAIDLSTTDDDVQMVTNIEKKSATTDKDIVTENTVSTIPDTHEDQLNSDDDLAQLRLQVLSTKTIKAKAIEETKPVQTNNFEDEDSDTAELRLICLKSALLKKAIEMKQEQKLQKRRSQSIQEEGLLKESHTLFEKNESGNNTDIESVDMDMGSDADEKLKKSKEENMNPNTKNTVIINKEDELEEDEDLLRAKLLTSLSKNLPNLLRPEMLPNSDEVNVPDKTSIEPKKTAVKLNVQKKFIIKIDESDSEGEHEATENLTKMHMKLSEQSDFQQKLDLFLKTTRLHVENNKLPDVVQKQDVPKKPEKYVAKAVNHLPKSEQLEYKNLVRRMAELEKMKQSRQMTLNSATLPIKDTLKPRNVDNNLEQKISVSRKRIADESAKMLKLKDEAAKLSQKYKIVATELHNLTTAITLNKKQQRAVQGCLAKIRQQHQLLIKSSSTSLHSKVNDHFNSFKKVISHNTKLQKENNPKDDYKNPVAQKTVKVSVVNDLKNEDHTTNTRLNVEVNVSNNKKVVRIPSPIKDRVVEITVTSEEKLQDTLELVPLIEETSGKSILGLENGEEQEIVKEPPNERYNPDDYKSPLDAFGATSCLETRIDAGKSVFSRLGACHYCNVDGGTLIASLTDGVMWKSDPNAILCPFEVGGQCKDPDCKYLHTH